MDPGGRKRMERATRISAIMEPALSARSELPKNSINIDKFTGFFNKKRNGETLVNHCNISILCAYLSMRRSNKALENTGTAHLPAFAMR